MKKILLNLNINQFLIALGGLALVFVVIFWFWWGSKEISISNIYNNESVAENFPKSPISGVSCERAKTRPVAVMISSDPITRPLSGLGSADIVFEMPVTPSGVTRMMAVFQCSEPGEIGSIRSAREDFIPLAAGLGTIYVHWGGEHEALKKLNGHIMDNIDAMVYEGIYFFRKNGVRQPHNGFTDWNKITRATDELKYGKDNSFSGYPHKDDKPAANLINIVDSISIDYPSPFDVKWIYNPEKNAYKRFRSGEPELDKNNNTQVEARVVAVVRTTASFTNKDYLTVNVTGEGEAEIYQNGVKVSGRWKKDSASLESKMFFYDLDGKEIAFAPGNIWVEFLTNL